ncbi:MAG: hypothetical protein QOD26_3483 [Betaproteobacteria bacterium]|jgi:hypothetical protein|nr:hypothetical protein [Betaproteobacteria bacterium]
MKSIFAAFLAVCVNDAAAQIVSRNSLHLQPVGSVVSGSFVLVNKVVPLPEGEFTLVATQVREEKFVSGDYARQGHKLVDVALGQIVDQRLRVAVGATALLAWGGGRREWTDEPCKRDDTLFRLNQTPFMKRNYEQNCLMVNYLVNSFGQSATGIYQKFAGWLKDGGGATPIATVMETTITRIAVGDYLAVRYLINPEAYGCDGAPSASWTTSDWHKSRIAKDPEKSRFANGVFEFGKATQVRINEAFEGRVQVAETLSATTPRFYRCAGAR